MIRVTVLTVAYNSEKTIARTIESVLNQTYQNIEYIIIDGVSKDGTVAIAEGYREAFFQVGKTMRIVSEKDQGMYDALNKGIRMAEGELIGGINSDDWYEPNTVERMAAFYEETQYDLAWADLRIVRESSSFIKRARIGRLWTTAGFCHPTMFARRSVLLAYPYALGYMDADFDMVTRAHRDGKKICLLNETLANYSFGGMSTKKSIKDFHKRVKMKYATYRRNGYSPLYWLYCVAVESAKYLLG